MLTSIWLNHSLAGLAPKESLNSSPINSTTFARLVFETAYF